MTRPYIERYNEIPVPLPMKSIDSIDEALERVEDDFFDRIVASFRLAEHVVATTFKTDYRIISRPLNKEYSCDLTSELWLEGVQPLATVLKVRDELNHQVSLFSKYPLTDMALLRLDSLEEFFED